MTTKQKFDIKVKWEDDENPDISYLGEYKKDKPKTAYIDRKHDLLVIPSRRMVKTFDTYEQADDFNQELEDLNISTDFWQEENENGKFDVEYVFYKELPFSCHYERNDFQYIESFNYPKPTDEELEYIIQDTKQLESFGYDWNMRGCTVTASLNGIVLGGDSLWGLDSTMTEKEDQEVIDELTSNAITEAKNQLKELKLMDV